MKIIPKGWTKFQHYKDRCPPWIKLHRDLLNNYDFALLPLEAKAVAPLLWLLAAESKDGEIDLSIDALAFRLHIDSKTISSAIKVLIEKDFFVDASNVLAECLQVAIPETETETEKETEKETKGERKKRQQIAKHSAKEILEAYGITGQIADDFIAQRKRRRSEITQTAMEGIRKEADKAGIPLEEVIKIIVVRGWQSFKAEWVNQQNGKNMLDWHSWDFVNQEQNTTDFLDADFKRIEK